MFKKLTIMLLVLALALTCTLANKIYVGGKAIYKGRPVEIIKDHEDDMWGIKYTDVDKFNGEKVYYIWTKHLLSKQQPKTFKKTPNKPNTDSIPPNYYPCSKKQVAQQTKLTFQDIEKELARLDEGLTGLEALKKNTKTIVDLLTPMEQKKMFKLKFKPQLDTINEGKEYTAEETLAERRRDIWSTFKRMFKKKYGARRSAPQCGRMIARRVKVSANSKTDFSNTTGVVVGFDFRRSIPKKQIYRMLVSINGLTNSFFSKDLTLLQ